MKLNKNTNPKTSKCLEDLPKYLVALEDLQRANESLKEANNDHFAETIKFVVTGINTAQYLIDYTVKSNFNLIEEK